MRVLWYSNAPWAPTGYGNQTGLIARYLPPLGYDLAIHANYGLMGTRLEIGGVKIFPNGRERWGNDIVNAYAEDWKAEAIISLYDAWPLKFSRLNVEQHRPWIAWVPIDHDEITPSVAEALRYAQGVVAYSKHGQAALQRAGFGAAYIPHGVDTNVYTPGNKLQARHNLELPVQDDTFLVGMVAANNFYPSRKCIPQALAAFARFHEQYPDSAIYLHMVDDESKEGVNVHDIAASLGLVEGKDVLIADQFDYQLGYPASAMADLYRSFDVLLNPSLGEGFGIPILEAMACGIPAIATTGTSMTELVEKVGWLVEGDPWWTAQGSWQTIPHVEGIVNALEQSCHYERNQFTARNDDARERALEYDFQTVVAPMWDEYLRGGEWRMRELKDDVVELAA